MQPIDWNPIKHDFITGIFQEGERFISPTYAMMAKKWHVNRNLLAEKGAEEDWIGQRDTYFSQVYEAATEQKKHEMASQSSQFDNEMFMFARYASKILSERLITRKRQRDPLSGKWIQQAEINYDINTLELKRLTDVAKSAQDIKERAVGDVNVKTDSSLEKLCGILGDLQEETF
jgi:hypothetical protein